MANFFQDNEDLAFYVERGIDWQPLVELIEHGFKSPDGFKSTEEAVASYKDIVELVGGFAADEVAPHSAAIERQGLKLEGGEVKMPPELDRAIEQMKGMSLFGMTMPRELGGMQCPSVLYYINSELLGRANVSLLTQYGFFSAISEALLLYSFLEGTTTFDPATGVITKTRFADEIGEVIRGEACGSMDITEANAGSDMAALKARAEQDQNGNWFVTGEKIFITQGQGKFHFVIARSENEKTAPGLEGLSLFLVPAYVTDASGARKRFVTVERLEEKLGHHASPTCVVTFDRSPAQLIGKRGEGFKLMLLLMNGARIGVGFEALGLCEAAYRAAKAYAAERKSMGKTLDHHEIIADYLDEAATDIQVIRALGMHGAYHEEMAFRTEIALKSLDPETAEARDLQLRLRRHRRESREVTPLVKFLGAEKAVEIARRAVQIHGGVGYTMEYPVARLLGDAIAMPIYEGTSQIQALMAMKDALGRIMRNPQGFMRKIAQSRLRSISAMDGLERGVAKLVSHSLSAQQHLMSRTATDKLKALSHEPVKTWRRAFFKQWDPKRDFAHAMLHAERLTQLLCDAKAAEILLAQARKHPERREVLERHLERAEPRARYLLEQISSIGDRLIDRLHGTEPAAEKQTA